jgi:hypothetical protein
VGTFADDRDDFMISLGAQIAVGEYSEALDLENPYSPGMPDPVIGNVVLHDASFAVKDLYSKDSIKYVNVIFSGDPDLFVLYGKNDVLVGKTIAEATLVSEYLVSLYFVSTQMPNVLTTNTYVNETLMTKNDEAYSGMGSANEKFLLKIIFSEISPVLSGAGGENTESLQILFHIVIERIDDQTKTSNPVYECDFKMSMVYEIEAYDLVGYDRNDPASVARFLDGFFSRRKAQTLSLFMFFAQYFLVDTIDNMGINTKFFDLYDEDLNPLISKQCGLSLENINEVSLNLGPFSASLWADYYAAIIGYPFSWGGGLRFAIPLSYQEALIPSWLLRIGARYKEDADLYGDTQRKLGLSLDLSNEWGGTFKNGSNIEYLSFYWFFGGVGWYNLSAGPAESGFGFDSGSTLINLLIGDSAYKQFTASIYVGFGLKYLFF